MEATTGIWCFVKGESWFNKLWVVESLRPGDLRTGTNLVESQLVYACRENPELAVELRQPGTKAEFLSLLYEIRDETRAGQSLPMLHFDCHGSPEGLETGNGELVDWDGLRKQLIEINHASGLNLKVVVAACNGAHLIKVSQKLDRAPFWAVIGPEVEIEAGELETGFSAYYETLFATMDGDAALEALNNGANDSTRQYHFFHVVGLFKKAYVEYHRKHGKGKGRQERIEDLVTTAMKNPDVQKRGVNWTRKQLKAELAKEREYFYNKRNRFFFVDEFPDNAKRFPLVYEDVIETAEK